MRQKNRLSLKDRLVQIAKDEKRANNFKDQTGKKFGLLTAIKLAGFILNNNGKRRMCYYVDCDCGTKGHLVRGNDLVTGMTYSCGCVNELRAKEMGFKKKRNSSSFVSALKAYYISAKQGAKARGFAFKLSLDEFFCLTQLNCYYCGCAPSTKRYSRIHTKVDYFLFNGVDRIDSSKGYEIFNVNPCCTICNLMKSKYSERDFLSQIKKINMHQLSINKEYSVMSVENNLRAQIETSRKLSAQKISFGYIK